MRRLRVLIVDDEPLARSGMRMLLEGGGDVEVAGESADGYSAVEAVQDLELDAVFLDVQMPGLDGFGVIDALQGLELPCIVFVTAYDEYALRAFRVNAVDYLLKPVDPAHVRAALQRVRERRDGRTSAEERATLERLIAERTQAAGSNELRYLQRILVRGPTRVFFVRAKHVIRVEAADNYLRIVTPEGAHLVRGTMREIEQRLDPAQFARIHRSVIVNLDCVREVQMPAPGEYTVLLTDGSAHRVGRMYRDAFLDQGF